MIASIRRFVGSENGATAVEYAILATMIALVTVVGLTAIGGELSGQFSQVSTMYK